MTRLQAGAVGVALCALVLSATVALADDPAPPDPAPAGPAPPDLAIPGIDLSAPATDSAPPDKPPSDVAPAPNPAAPGAKPARATDPKVAGSKAAGTKPGAPNAAAPEQPNATSTSSSANNPPDITANTTATSGLLSLAQLIFKKADVNKQTFLNKGTFKKADAMLVAAINDMVLKHLIGLKPTGGKGPDRAPLFLRGFDTADADSDGKVTLPEFTNYVSTAIDAADQYYQYLADHPLPPDPQAQDPQDQQPQQQPSSPKPKAKPKAKPKKK